MSARRPCATAKVEASSAEPATRRPLDTRFCTWVSWSLVARRYFCASKAPTLVFTDVIASRSSILRLLARSGRYRFWHDPPLVLRRTRAARDQEEQPLCHA